MSEDLPEARSGKACFGWLAAGWMLICMTLQCHAQCNLRFHITFDGPPLQPPGTAKFVKQYSESGMSFTPINPDSQGFVRTGAATDPRDPDNGTAYLQAALGDSLEFSFLNRAVFDVVSVDLAEYSTVVPDAVTVHFVGYRQDGSMVTVNFTTDGIIDGTGPLADFETFTFDDRFTGLTRVEIPDFGSLDNLVVAAHWPPIGALLQPVAWGGYAQFEGQAIIPPALTNAIAIATGGTFGGLLNVAVLPDGTVASWGGDYHGQTNVPPGLGNVISVAAGGQHCLALRANGTVTGWGSSLAPASLTNPPPGLNNVVAIAAGHTFNLALRSDGTIIQWPTNEVPAGLSEVVAIAAGVSHSLALRSDGTVVGWGKNSFSVTNVPAEASNVVAIAAGYVHSVALRSDGTVVAWGDNTRNQTAVPQNMTNVIAVAAGWDTSLALRRDGTVGGWGYNTAGQISLPPMSALSNVVAISVGYAQSLALVGNTAPEMEAQAGCPELTAGGFSLSLPSQSGKVYRLEYAETLSDAEWTPLPLVAGKPGGLVLTDPSATNAPRFYRVRRW